MASRVQLFRSGTPVTASIGRRPCSAGTLSRQHARANIGPENHRPPEPAAWRDARRGLSSEYAARRRGASTAFIGSSATVVHKVCGVLSAELGGLRPGLRDASIEDPTKGAEVAS